MHETARSSTSPQAASGPSTVIQGIGILVILIIGVIGVLVFAGSI